MEAKKDSETAGFLFHWGLTCNVLQPLSYDHLTTTIFPSQSSYMYMKGCWLSVCHNAVVSATMHGYKEEDCEGMDCGCLVVIVRGLEQLFYLSNVPPSHVGWSLISFSLSLSRSLSHSLSLCFFIDLVVKVEMKIQVNIQQILLAVRLLRITMNKQQRYHRFVAELSVSVHLTSYSTWSLIK